MKAKIKYIEPDQLSTIRMTCGGEKKHPIVLDWELVRKRWVGFGWVNEGEPDPGDLKKYPVVRRTLK